MNPTCARCGRWIEQSNVRYPGFCTPGCHGADRAERDACLAEQAAKRRELREERQTREFVLT